MSYNFERIDFDLPIPESLGEALALLKQSGGSCFIVGGCVRDALEGISPTDFDVEVFGLELDEIAAILSKVGKTDLVGRSFAVVKLWSKGAEYDFSVPRTETKSGQGHRGFDIETDPNLDPKLALKRRDFTINALQYDPCEKTIIDYFGGLDDLKGKELRHVGSAFSEDPLRALRAMQFAGRFGLSLNTETAELCREMKREFAYVANERIWGEWQKWACQSTTPSKGLIALKASGWISFFPEINALLRLPQEPEWHPEGDVFTHTLHCIDALAGHPDWSGFGSDTKATLMLATLCHDLGKARRTRYVEFKGALRWTSPGHDQESGWLSDSLMTRIGAPDALKEKVKALVVNHHFLSSFIDSQPSDASLKRLSTRIQPATTNELYYVMWADHNGRPPLLSEKQEKRLVYFKKRIRELAVEDEAPKPILLGRHLIEKGLEPGPQFKPILSKAYEAQLKGAFDNLDGALDWMERESLV